MNIKKQSNQKADMPRSSVIHKALLCVCVCIFAPGVGSELKPGSACRSEAFDCSCCKKRKKGRK